MRLSSAAVDPSLARTTKRLFTQSRVQIAPSSRPQTIQFAADRLFRYPCRMGNAHRFSEADLKLVSAETAQVIDASVDASHKVGGKLHRERFNSRRETRHHMIFEALDIDLATSSPPFSCSSVSIRGSARYQDRPTPFGSDERRDRRSPQSQSHPIPIRSKSLPFANPSLNGHPIAGAITGSQQPRHSHSSDHFPDRSKAIGRHVLPHSHRGTAGSSQSGFIVAAHAFSTLAAKAGWCRPTLAA